MLPTSKDQSTWIIDVSTALSMTGGFVRAGVILEELL